MSGRFAARGSFLVSSTKSSPTSPKGRLSARYHGTLSELDGDASKPKQSWWTRKFRSKTSKLRHLMEGQHEAAGEVWLLREQVYSLSRTVGLIEARIQLDDLSDTLRSWRDTDNPTKRQLIAKHIESDFGFDGCLVVTDMSGFTRVTREEGILHFMMLIKEMQAICVPIFERYGGRLVKVEADDLFVIFPASCAELAIRAVLRCMKVTSEFSQDKERNSQIIVAAGIIAGPMYLLPGLDVFGGVVPLGFRIGEDEAPNGMLYVLQRVERGPTCATPRHAPSRLGRGRAAFRAAPSLRRH